jgi:hypothetical protein
MKTYPIYMETEKLRGFEITSSWFRFGPLLKILKSVEGVTDVKRQWFNDDRVLFKFYGKNGIVNEPFGDNSRYWVGLEYPDESPDLNISSIHEAFKNYNGRTFF